MDMSISEGPQAVLSLDAWNHLVAVEQDLMRALKGRFWWCFRNTLEHVSISRSAKAGFPQPCELLQVLTVKIRRAKKKELTKLAQQQAAPVGRGQQELGHGMPLFPISSR